MNTKITLGLAFVLIALSVEAAFGQAIPSAGSGRVWAAPVRDAPVQQAQYLSEPSHPGLDSLRELPSGQVPMDVVPVNALRGLNAPQPHQVIVSPDRHPATGKKLPHHLHAYHPHYWSQHHRPVQPVPAAVPHANQRKTWKTPYSYGYFGASSSRHWTLHFGHRDRYTEWRLH